MSWTPPEGCRVKDAVKHIILSRKGNIKVPSLTNLGSPFRAEGWQQGIEQSRKGFFFVAFPCSFFLKNHSITAKLKISYGSIAGLHHISAPYIIQQEYPRNH